MRKRLSTSVYDFSTIIQENGMYVDKTREIYRMVDKLEGQFFLSRPRRFGKSLTLSTLESVFRGQKELFKGLYIYDQPYDWKVYPIIRLSMNTLSASTHSEFAENLSLEMDRMARKETVKLWSQRPAQKFNELIDELSQKHGQKVVILIDEYDKPILDNILNTDEVLKIRTLLKQFYGMIKAMEEHIRFSFITGVSKFTHVSIFSDLNNLDDATMMGEYATLCGFTQEEVEHYFTEWIDENALKNQLSREAYLDKVRKVYNGLRFSKDPVTVYNPVSLTKAMDRGDFEHYWFETGTPSFLLELLKRQQDNSFDQQGAWTIPEFDGMKLTSDSFSSYEVENIKVEALLFQTGYLSIVDYEPETNMYSLGYPNDEVRFSFVKRLSDYFTPVPESRVPSLLDQLDHALQKHDMNGVFEVLTVFYAKVDNSIKIQHEKYYQSIFYILFTLLGYRIQVEVNTNKGRMDAVVQSKDRIYIFEFKLNHTAQEALEQIHQREYVQRFLLEGRSLTLVGVAFDGNSGSIAEWKCEEIGE